MKIFTGRENEDDAGLRACVAVRGRGPDRPAVAGGGNRWWRRSRFKSQLKSFETFLAAGAYHGVKYYGRVLRILEPVVRGGKHEAVGSLQRCVDEAKVTCFSLPRATSECQCLSTLQVWE